MKTANAINIVRSEEKELKKKIEGVRSVGIDTQQNS